MKHQFRHHHLPFLAFESVLVLRFRIAPSSHHNGQDCCRPQAHGRRRRIAFGEAAHHVAGVVQQLPRLLRGTDSERVTGRKSGDGTMHWVVDASAFELSVLIVLDQMMIGVAGEGQGIEPQGIYRRQAQRSQAGFCRTQMGQVERDQIMAQQVIRTLGECVQVFQGRVQVSAVKCLGLAASRP